MTSGQKVWVAVTVGVVGVAVLAVASQARARAAPACPAPVILGTAPSLHPEGIAWDPTRRAFLVSSVRHGTVSVVQPDGTVRTLVSDPHMVSTFGVHVDARRGRVLVAFADFGVSERPTLAKKFQVAGVGIFDLATGRPLHIVDLTSLADRHIANDLALDTAGNAYVTDPGADGIYRVDPAGQVSVFARDPRFVANIGLNGIVWHPAGYLLAVNYTTGALFRITAGRVDEVRLDRPLVGGDGMALRSDGALVVVSNSLPPSPGVDAVRVLRANHRWTAARTTRITEPWPDLHPTTVALTPTATWVLYGRLEVLIQQRSTSDEFTIRRF